jgi:hypothetical protein
MSAFAMMYLQDPSLLAFQRRIQDRIQNSDGNNKQDCEINAAKRLIAKIRKTHPKLPIIIGGDGLYSKQPFIDDLKAANMSFISMDQNMSTRSTFLNTN